MSKSLICVDLAHWMPTQGGPIRQDFQNMRDISRKDIGTINTVTTFTGSNVDDPSCCEGENRPKNKQYFIFCNFCPYLMKKNFFSHLISQLFAQVV